MMRPFVATPEEIEPAAKAKPKVCCELAIVMVPRLSGPTEYVPVNGWFAMTPPGALVSKTPLVRLPFPSATKLPATATGAPAFSNALRPVNPLKMRA
jgi:hypothetical protein